ncbi:hypothetical protein [[Bacillus] enclensis]|uniref:hypothetical protein n=1 Tax=[Bacillus] enclensis TaxID=1402860 RepID=UPI0018DBD5CE|nr:hypothetical protein [[Bacillus] enclensis]MBH9968474.1 hypothetical protein [[Bacillus] enclensis]
MKDILKRPAGMMRKLEKQVVDYFGSEIHKEHELFKELTLLIEMCHTIYHNQEKFTEMYKEICVISDTQNINKVLKEETFNRLYELAIVWHVLLYKEQRMQLLNYYDLSKIMKVIENDKKAKKLYKSLGNFHTEKRRKVITSFLEGVIDKEIGDVSELSYTSEDVETFRRYKIKEGEQGFETNLAPQIRN